MIRRISLVLVTAAALLPFTAGPASASCLDDATSRSLTEGYYVDPKSPYWNGLNYVGVSGTATVTVQGDALVSDAGSFVANDMPRYTTLIVLNSADITLDFVNCVAG